MLPSPLRGARYVIPPLSALKQPSFLVSKWSCRNMSGLVIPSLPTLQQSGFHVSKSSCRSMSGISQCSTSEEPMRSLRLKLGQFFSKADDYILRVTKNMRFYSWRQVEIDTLFQDLTDSMEHTPDSTYELNQIIAVKEKHKDGEVWEVADGQQRLITLCLLHCAMRDSLEEGHDLRKELQEHLIFKSYKKPDRPRVTIRAKHNEVLLQLLQGDEVKRKAKRCPTANRGSLLLSSKPCGRRC
jgi:hypothetical protein